MCIICVDYQKQLITNDEARRNMREMVLDPEHRLELLIKLERDKVEKLIAEELFPTRIKD